MTTWLPGASGGTGGGGDASAANQVLAIAALETLDLNSDQIEALLTVLGTSTDGLETLVTAGNASLAALITPSSNATSAALANTGVIKASAGTLFGVSGYSDAAGFVLIHNKATAPAGADAPIVAIPVTVAGAWSIDYGIRGRAMSTGISIGFSATGPTFTAGGGSHITYDAQYS